MATSKSKHTYELRQLGDFFVGDSEISNVVPCPNSDTAWINCSKSKDIFLLDGRGETKQKVTTPHNQCIHQLTLGSNDELLMTCVPS